MDKKLIPRMRVVRKEEFVEDNYKITVSTSMDVIKEASDSTILVLQTQFRNVANWIDNVWVIDEDTDPELFMELMFGGAK